MHTDTHTHSLTHTHTHTHRHTHIDTHQLTHTHTHRHTLTHPHPHTYSHSHILSSHYIIKRNFRPRKSKSQQQKGLALNAGEAIERMLVEKRISSKINYDVLKDLADGFGVAPSELNLSSNLKPVTTISVQDRELNSEGTESMELSISRGPSVASGRLPSLSVRKRTFSSLEPSSGLELPAK